jgi:hypothetical protein
VEIIDLRSGGLHHADNVDLAWAPRCQYGNIRKPMRRPAVSIVG